MRTIVLTLALLCITTACAGSSSTSESATSPSTASEPTPARTVSASPTSAASPEPTGSATPERPGRAAHPGTVVVNAPGELQVRDAGDGSVVRVLARFDDPEEYEGPVAGGVFLDEVRRDGDRVLFTTCCEPAFGEVEAIPITEGERQRVAAGLAPAVSPDGTLAVVQGTEIVLHPGTASERRLAAAEPPGGLAHLTFGPDGRLLAGVWSAAGEQGPEPDEVFVLDLGSAASLDDATRHDPDAADVAWTAPAFRSDGRLVVAEQPSFAAEEDQATATGIVLEPVSGDPVTRFPLGGSVVSQRYDATGVYLLTVHHSGRLDWRGAGDGGEIVPEGVLDAAW